MSMPILNTLKQLFKISTKSFEKFLKFTMLLTKGSMPILFPLLLALMGWCATEYRNWYLQSDSLFYRVEIDSTQKSEKLSLGIHNLSDRVIQMMIVKIISEDNKIFSVKDEFCRVWVNEPYEDVNFRTKCEPKIVKFQIDNLMPGESVGSEFKYSGVDPEIRFLQCKFDAGFHGDDPNLQKFIKDKCEHKPVEYREFGLGYQIATNYNKILLGLSLFASFVVIFLFIGLWNSEYGKNREE